MIYNDLYDLEGFIRINTLNDLKTKNFNLKANDIVFVVETLTFYKITNELISNTESVETFSNLKAIKYKTIVDYNEFINLLENEKNNNLSKNEELKQALNEEKNKRENFKSEFNTFKQTNIANINNLLDEEKNKRTELNNNFNVFKESTNNSITNLTNEKDSLKTITTTHFNDITNIINGNLYNIQQVAGGYIGNGPSQLPNYVGRGKVRFLMTGEYFNNSDWSYKDWIYMNTYTGGDVPQTTAFGISKNSGNDLHAYLMRSDNNNTSWQLKEEIWHTGNLKNITNIGGNYCFKNGQIGIVSGWTNEINFTKNSEGEIWFNYRTVGNRVTRIIFGDGTATGNGGSVTMADLNARHISASGDISGSRVFNAVWNDYAEYFPKKKETFTEPGDIIALDENSDDEYYVKATDSHSVIVGVHSDEFGHLIGGKKPKENEDYLEINKEDFIPIGLAGRVKVKFKGIAKKGMKVVPSEIAGVGREFNLKIDSLDKIIGTILENNLEEKIKKVKIKIK